VKGNTSLKPLLRLAVVVVTVLLTPSVRAAEPTVAVHIEGGLSLLGSDTVRAELLSLLPAAVVVAEERSLRFHLATRGLRRVGGVVSKPARRALAMKSLRAAVKAVHASDALFGRLVAAASDVAELRLLHVSAEAGEPLIDAAILLDTRDAVARLAALEAALRPLLDRLGPPATLPTERPPERPPPPPPPPAEPIRPARRPGAERLMLAPAYRLAGRRFRYDEPRTLNLRPLDAFDAHMVGLALGAYPFREVPFLDYVGIEGSYARAIGLSTESPGGEELANIFDELRIELRVRVPTGEPPAPVLSVGGGFGSLRYQFPIENNPFFAELPDVWYVFASGALEVRVALGPIGLFAGGAYLGLISSGEVAARFTDSEEHGIEGRVGVGVQIVEWLEARLAADYVVVLYDFDPAPRDRYVAASARDEILCVQTSVAFLYF
jgi:hypothetical protein